MNDNLDFVIALPKEKFINQEQYEKLGTVAWSFTYSWKKTDNFLKFNEIQSQSGTFLIICQMEH
jgi:hypothetical protein